MKSIFLLLVLGQFPNFFGPPVQAEQPKQEQKQLKTLYIAIDKDDFSQQLKMELTKEWNKIQPPKRTTESTEDYNNFTSKFYEFKYKMIRLNHDIRNRVKLEIVEDISQLPIGCPAFAFGKNTKWESFPKEAFRDYSFPLQTVLYEIDLWYLEEWREKMEQRRFAEWSRVSKINEGVLEVNNSIIETRFGSCYWISPSKQVTAIYAFNGKSWDKIAVPKQGCNFIPKNEVVSIELQYKNKHIHKVETIITSYEVAKDIYAKDTIFLDMSGLNSKLMPEIFPYVELLPNPPWEPKYSFVPF